MTEATPSRAGGRGDPSATALSRELLSLLDEQAGLYRRLDELSRKQTDLIDEDDADGLLILLTERQELIDRLEHCNRKLAVVRQSWEQRADEVGGEEREHVRQVAVEIAQIASRIVARDDHDRRRLESRRDRIADEMLTLSRSRRAVASYGPPGGAATPTYQDRQG